MYKARANHRVAEAFAFGPPKIFEGWRLACVTYGEWRPPASAMSGYELRKGRPEQPGLVAEAQQLQAGLYLRRDREVASGRGAVNASPGRGARQEPYPAEDRRTILRVSGKNSGAIVTPGRRCVDRGPKRARTPNIASMALGDQSSRRGVRSPKISHSSRNLVSRDGIEPPTRGFSILCSTD